MEKNMSYAERQAQWIKDNDLKVGDEVRVLKSCEGYTDGWKNTWNNIMTYTVDTIGIFKEETSNDKGIKLLIAKDTWNYPYFVLEKVVKQEEIKVGDYVIKYKNQSFGVIYIPSKISKIEGSIAIFDSSYTNNPLTNLSDYKWNFRKCTDEEVLEHLIKQSGLSIGDEVTYYAGSRVSGTKIVNFQLTKNINTTGRHGAFNPGISDLSFQTDAGYWNRIDCENFKVINKAIKINTTMKTEFTKNDLRTGMLVRYAKDKYKLVMLNTEKGDFLISKEGKYEFKTNNDNLSYDGDRSIDIVEVWSITNNICNITDITINDRKLLWQREEEIKIGSYPVEFNSDGSINVGCRKKADGKEISLQTIKNMYNSMCSLGMKEVTIEGIKINFSTVSTILDKATKAAGD